MKKLLILILISAAIPALAQIKSASLTASGLTCSMCSKAIYKALLKLPEVRNVQVDIADSKYAIEFKTGVPVAIDNIKKAVENAGFSVASLQVTADFKNAEVFNDAHISVEGNNLHFLNVNKQTLNGQKTFTVVDKNYLPAKAHNKYAQYTKMPCFETGMMAACCTKHGSASRRIYHVTL